jgi:D-3-phosphoglycerate dehydrogenase / 2-oxoglutarate reductase
MIQPLGNVLIAAQVHPTMLQVLKEKGYNCIVRETITRAESMALIYDCVGVITSTKLLLDKELLDAAPQLRWVGRMGSGMEIIDVLYAESKNITCVSSPEGNCNAVGEHAVGMLLGITKKIVVANQQLLNGFWKRDENRGFELENRTIGIIGFGHTGQAFAKKLSGFDMNILAYDKYNAAINAGSVKLCSSLEPIFEQAAIVSFHVPLQQDTFHYFNEVFLERMQHKFILINTSRGNVVATGALHQGLKSGKILGACIDVFEHEPFWGTEAPEKLLMQEIIKFPNVLATPHIAGYSDDATRKMTLALLEKLPL